MDKAQLAAVYRDYIACLNRRDWKDLALFVDEAAEHNGRHLGVAGYRAMLETDVDEIPDLQFHIEVLMSDPPFIAARLGFDCHPKGRFLDLPVEGRRVRFSENVFYEFRGGKIVRVMSLLDRAAIEKQIGA